MGSLFSSCETVEDEIYETVEQICEICEKPRVHFNRAYYPKPYCAKCTIVKDSKEIGEHSTDAEKFAYGFYNYKYRYCPIDCPHRDNTMFP